MTEREAEKQVSQAVEMFDRYIAWKKDITMCPFHQTKSAYAWAHWWQMVSEHTKNQLSKEVVAS